MKKLLLLVLSTISVSIMAQSFSVTPKYGCPETTQDVTIAFSAPLDISSYTVSLTISDGSTVLKTYSGSNPNPLPANTTGYIFIDDVPFTGVTSGSVCTVTGTVTAQTMIGPYPYNVNQNYTVQYPPNLDIIVTSGELSVTTALDVYSVRYYLNADYGTVVDESTSGLFTPTTDGTYNAKAYDPATGCLSVAPSNPIIISAISNAQLINVSVYPNPMVSSITVAADNMSVTYTITNALGTALKTGSINQIGAISVDDLQAGTYVLTVSDLSGKSSSYTLVK